MRGPQVARRSLAIAALVTLFGVAGCAGGAGGTVELGDAEGPSVDEATVSVQDYAAIGQLAEIAARDAEPEGPVGATECWAPSQNPVPGDSSTGGGDPEGDPGKAGTADESRASAEDGFRVICRVHFEQQGTQRYRDMICIGNLGRDPVAEYCYQWAHYADAPKFEDRPAFGASGPGSH